MNDQTTSLLAICRRILDPDARPAATYVGHRGTIVLRATTSLGDVIVKRHRGLDRHQQEVRAYRQWTPALGGQAPQLLAATDDPPAIVITALAGRTLAEASISPAHEADLHREAGELLRAFHHAAPPRAEPDMTVWLAERGEHWLALAEDILTARRLAEIRAHLRALIDLAPIPAVPCHLDYTPRNLFLTTAGQLAVIDFEHARYDLAARDLVRLATRTWPQRPDLEQAFVNGYGPRTGLDRQVIEHCAHLDALTQAVRATQLSNTGAMSGV